MKSRIWKKTIPIYGAKLFLSVAPSLKLAFDQLPDLFKSEPLDPDWKAGYIRSGNKWAILLNSKRIRHGAISHEIHHVSGSVMAFIGEDLKEWSSESVAYLDDWITEWVYRSLDSAGLKPRSKA